MSKIKNIFEKAIWSIQSKKLKKCGKNTLMRRKFILRGEKNISIGNKLYCAANCELATWSMPDSKEIPELKIGNNVTMAEGCFISCSNKIEIGDGCLFGVNVFVTDNYHGNNTIEQILIPPNRRNLYSKGPVLIGKNVWIGRNVCIMPGVKVGDYSVIGANSVVTHDIPMKTIVGGVPARVLKNIE